MDLSKHSNIIDKFCFELMRNKNFVGQIVEFGTATGDSTEKMNAIFEGQKKITTFDGFVGFPKTNKVVPKNSGWFEGNCYFNEDIAKNRFKYNSNIHVVKCLTSELKDPSYYGISQVAGVNMDLDLYEGTLDGLNFIDKCDWNCLLVRFDDWGALVQNNQIPEEFAEHEQAAFYDFINKTKYKYKFYEEYTSLSFGLQKIIEIQR